MPITIFEITGTTGVTDNGVVLIGQELSIKFRAKFSAYDAMAEFTAKQNNNEIARYSRHYSAQSTYYSGGTINDNFYIGKIQGTGNIVITGVATEMIPEGSNRWHAGTSTTITKTYTTGDYKATTITALNGMNIVERCKQTQDAYGSNAGYQAASDGDRIMLNFQVSVPTVSGKSNSATVNLLYGRGSTVGTNLMGSKSFGTATPSSSVRKLNDTTSITTIFDVAHDYWFSLVATDSFGMTITKNAYIGKMESIFNIEPYGVAIGQLSTGTSANKKFECAYPAYFGGAATFSNGATIANPTFTGTIKGISTSTTYKSGEVDTGDKWIDGKAIYRFIWSGTSDLENEQGILCNLSSKASTIIFAGGMFQRPSDSAWLTMPNTYYADNAAWAVNLRIENGQEVYIGFGSKATGTKNVIFCCLYTK